MFRAVLFDLWETLINDTPERALPRRTWRAGAIAEVLQRHDSGASLDAIRNALDSSTQALTSLHDQGEDLGPGGRAQLFLTQLEEQTGLVVPESATPELEDVITSMPLDMAPLVAPFGVETVAETRARGLATALVCNAGFTTTPHLLGMLAHYGLSQHLDVMVFSDELGVAKPNPRIFAHALEGLGLAASECAFIGDNPHTDIAGAQAAGMFAVQVGSKHLDGVTPNARIESLGELLAVLDGAS